MALEAGVRIAVIGVDGFIGGAVFRALVSTGMRPSPLGRPRSDRDRAEQSSLIESLDYVIFAAGGITPALAAEQPRRVEEELVALDHVLQASKRGGRNPRVVLISSGGAVYAPHSRPPFSESSPVHATSAYGAVKLEQERMLLQAEDFIVPVILRVANVYGPGQAIRGSLGVVAHWLDAVARGNRPQMIGDPLTRRDYIYVDDVVDAILRVVRTRPDMRAVFNIGSGKPTSLAELKVTIEAVVGHGLEVTQLPARAFDRGDVWLDVAVAEAVLGWRPATALRSGIARFWTWRQRQPAKPCEERD